MSVANTSPAATASALCRSCGLCCTGHLFVWTKLRAAEMESIQSLGVKVFREPDQRGFNQPCPLWEGDCTIYRSVHYPNFCRTYKCRLLKALLNESVEFADALKTVLQTKRMIAELTESLPPAADRNFRERLVAFIEDQQEPSSDRIQKAKELLAVFDVEFGVKDLLSH